VRTGYLDWAEVAERIEAKNTVHASLGGPGTAPICGELLTRNSMTLDITHPEGGQHKHTVTCQGCLEWLHA
jgi:hypothetical protein